MPPTLNATRSILQWYNMCSINLIHCAICSLIQFLDTIYKAIYSGYRRMYVCTCGDIQSKNCTPITGVQDIEVDPSAPLERCTIIELSSSTGRMEIFVTGRLTTSSAVLIETTLLTPSLPGYTSMMRPNLQRKRGRLSSLTTTVVSGVKLLWNGGSPLVPLLKLVQVIALPTSPKIAWSSWNRLKRFALICLRVKGVKFLRSAQIKCNCR